MRFHFNIVFPIDAREKKLIVILPIRMTTEAITTNHQSDQNQFDFPIAFTRVILRLPSRAQAKKKKLFRVTHSNRNEIKLVFAFLCCHVVAIDQNRQMKFLDRLRSAKLCDSFIASESNSIKPPGNVNLKTQRTREKENSERSNVIAHQFITLIKLLNWQLCSRGSLLLSGRRFANSNQPFTKIEIRF